MLSPETLQSYRAMTPGQRLRLTLDITEENERFLLMGSEEQVSRKFELLNQRNDQRNQAMLTALMQAEQTRLRHHEGKSDST
jgi:hypothetical protein